MEGPLVSICIPVYNGEAFIEETIRCCLNQTYQNIEIIFSDNCSTDRTIELIRQHNDPRIKIFSNTRNEGLLYNFRKVFSYATGKYIAFLGADDGMEHDAIEKGVRVLEDPDNADIVLVNTNVQIINEKSELIYTKKFPFGSRRFSSYWAIRSNFLFGTNIIGEPNGSLFRKSAYDLIPAPKLMNGNGWTIDVDLKLELLLHGDAYFIPEPLGKFRLSNQSSSKKDLRFTHAKQFREYAYKIYRDRRYNLSIVFFVTAAVNSIFMEIARNIFYILFIRRASGR